MYYILFLQFSNLCRSFLTKYLINYEKSWINRKQNEKEYNYVNFVIISLKEFVECRFVWWGMNQGVIEMNEW